MHKQLILHIGTYKTGSTSIQKFLEINRDVLLADGIYYPEFIDSEGYRDLNNGNMWPFQVADDKKEKIAIDSLQKMFLNHDTILISGEDFWGSGRKERKLSLLKELNVKIKVIVYLRRQDKYLDSLFNQLVKQDHFYYELGNWKNNYMEWMHADYDEELVKIESVIGKENIIVRIFDKSNFTGGDLLKDFSELLKIQLDERYSIPERVNESLCEKVLAIKNRYNHTLQYSALNGWPNPLEIKLCAAIELVNNQLNDVAAAVLEKNEIEEIMHKYEERNRNIARRYFAKDNLIETKGDNKQILEQNIDIDVLVEVLANIYVSQEREFQKVKVDLQGGLEDFKLLQQQIDENKRRIEQQRESYERRINEKQMEIDAMKNGYSWKITAPLRKIRRLIYRQ